MLVINSQKINNYFWKCRPPLFELLLIIRHQSADHAFHVRYIRYHELLIIVIYELVVVDNHKDTQIHMINLKILFEIYVPKGRYCRQVSIFVHSKYMYIRRRYHCKIWNFWVNPIHGCMMTWSIIVDFDNYFII